MLPPELKVTAERFLEKEVNKAYEKFFIWQFSPPKQKNVPTRNAQYQQQQRLALSSYMPCAIKLIIL